MWIIWGQILPRFFKLDPLRKDLPRVILQNLGARRRKNFETHTEYLLKNFYKVAAEIMRF